MRRAVVGFAVAFVVIWAIASAQTPKQGGGPIIFQGTARADKSFVVDIAGTTGAPFSGSCLVTSAGKSVSHDAAGTVPRTLHLEGSLVSCVVQKKQQGGTLTLRITRPDGTTVGESTTKQPYGVATLAGQ